MAAVSSTKMGTDDLPRESRMFAWLNESKDSAETMSLEQINNELKDLFNRLKIAKEKAANVVPEKESNRVLHSFSKARKECTKMFKKRDYVVEKPNMRFFRVYELLMPLLELTETYEVSVMVNYARREDHDVFKQLKTDGTISQASKMSTASILNSSLWFSYAPQYHSVDIFHGNYGIDCIKNGKYERQEDMAADGICSEILFGMLLLRENGSMIIKSYTFFTKKMQCALGMLFNHFNVQIVKGRFSKSTNSERFIVCTNYRNILTYAQVMEFSKRMSCDTYPLQDVLTIERSLVEHQIKALEVNVEILTCYKKGELNTEARAEFLSKCL